ncbi:MAG: redox-sensitive transcriptional activator SoxR [Hyphomonas sp.]|uniref:redox-sensitive transcriptional activator SoxR n=1 Tax=Hyphomonas sp. TaxID=87 RepID=UPI001827F0B1|nr:redox-sensitive transcriptional activator SoxR [Hyphomonas sp.]MBU3919902.1 redox-sensitive transcriptional activator SoxR [Alphaproteobacteria bacterium]MBA3067404.1 redox-sensitive transcriptional activator SoxR [Hyphomonas sp.]MBU4061044.1 redox-sensitive transcriptional activator SoxR [Alphaproteobacteria bacterium]MBU4165900.1 redox-sensitive transcriptional activator SoxR [Alphaproteobacteria bacterium]MBU4568033.1 redox-sensitive transcriptional activator SoxR [Alphaproteobacteria ba
MRADDVMLIGDMAARTGLSVSAIRFYEARGLIAPVRSPGGQRRFRRADIRRLSFIRIAQQLGLTIEDISAELNKLPSGRTPTAGDWARISRSIRASLDEQIAALTQVRNRLDGCIGCGCLSLKKCALYNAGDRAASTGAGPRYLMGENPDR